MKSLMEKFEEIQQKKHYDKQNRRIVEAEVKLDDLRSVLDKLEDQLTEKDELIETLDEIEDIYLGSISSDRWKNFKTGDMK